MSLRGLISKTLSQTSCQRLLYYDRCDMLKVVDFKILPNSIEIKQEKKNSSPKNFYCLLRNAKKFRLVSYSFPPYLFLSATFVVRYCLFCLLYFPVVFPIVFSYICSLLLSPSICRLIVIHLLSFVSFFN